MEFVWILDFDFLQQLFSTENLIQPDTKWLTKCLRLHSLHCSDSHRKKKNQFQQDIQHDQVSSKFSLYISRMILKDDKAYF